jgi:nucleoside-diphosphate-sugar epimerase
VFDTTHDKVVDETYERPDRAFLSSYDGPHDRGEIGAQIDRAARGTYRLRWFPDLGPTMSHVDDVADGVHLTRSKGMPGDACILGGEIARLGTDIDSVSAAAGRGRPRWTVPKTAVTDATPFGFLVGPLLGVGSNLRETVRASLDVTRWASSTKAGRDLGYAPRGLEQGVRDLLAAR